MICLIDCTDLGDPAGNLLHSHLPDPQNPGPCICSVRAPGEVREARRRFFYIPEQGHVSIAQLLGLLPNGKRVRATLTLVELPCSAFISWMKGSNFTGLFLLHTHGYFPASPPPLRDPPPVHTTCRGHFHCPPAVTVGHDTPYS